MSLSSRFWDKTAERYAKTPVADEESYRHKLKVTRTYFTPDSNVLEFGCGTGSTAIAHAPYVKHIRAIDFSQKMIEIAQGKAAAEGLQNIAFEVAAIDALNAPDQSYDAVLGLSVLHLLDDKDEAIAKVYRLLKPGGVFISNTVCIGGLMKLIAVIGPIGRALGLMPMVKVLSEKGLESSLTGAGFMIDYRWQPAASNPFGKTLFIVAKKPAG